MAADINLHSNIDTKFGFEGEKKLSKVLSFDAP